MSTLRTPAADLAHELERRRALDVACPKCGAPLALRYFPHLQLHTLTCVSCARYTRHLGPWSTIKRGGPPGSAAARAREDEP